MTTFYTNVAKLGNKILYRGFNKNGRVEEKYDFSPTLFVHAQKETGWKDVHGRNVLPKTFDTMGDARDFYSQYKDVDNFEVHGNTNYVVQFIQDKFPGKIEFKPNLVRVGNIDIEVQSDDGFPEPDEAKFPVTAITYKDNYSHVYHAFGVGDFDPAKSELDGVTIQYRKCLNERDLIVKFLTYWEANCPDVITGWNIQLFDIPYMCNRILRILGEESMKRLSPWRRVNYRKKKFMTREFDTYDIVGVQTLDYMDIFKKFDFVYGTLESYSLDHVSHVVLGERKLSYEEHGSLHNLLTSKSRNITVDATKPKENMADFEKWCLLRDKIKNKMK